MRASGTRLTLSKLCRYLGLAIVVKLAVFFSLAGNFGFFSGDPAQKGDGIVNLSVMPALSEADAQNANQGATPQPPPPPVSSAPPSTNSTAPASPGPGTSGAQASGGDAMLREALERRQADLDRREAELHRLEQALNEKLLNMQAMEARIQTMLKEAQTLKDDKMRHLVDVYTNMKAQQAAQVLETLDERTAVRILAGMRGRQAGEILTYVKPEKAARLSEMLTRMQLPFQN